MFCKSCGQQIDNDSDFCSFCGAKQSLVNKPNTNITSLNISSTQSPISNVYQPPPNKIPRQIVKGSKLILFLFLSFIATGLLISLTNFGHIPALWAIPFAVAGIYLLIYPTSKKAQEENVITNVVKDIPAEVVLPLKTIEEIERERLEREENEKFSDTFNKWVGLTFLGILLLIFILFLSSR